MKRMSFIGEVSLFLIAIYVFVESSKLRIWVEGGPGEGFFPLILSLFLGTMSGLSLLKAYFNKSWIRQPDQMIREPIKLKNLVVYILAISVYAIILNPLGFIISSILVLSFILRFAEGEDLLTISLVNVGTLIFSYILFERWLKVSLPKGILGMWW